MAVDLDVLEFEFDERRHSSHRTTCSEGVRASGPGGMIGLPRRAADNSRHRNRIFELAYQAGPDRSGRERADGAKRSAAPDLARRLPTADAALASSDETSGENIHGHQPEPRSRIRSIRSRRPPQPVWRGKPSTPTSARVAEYLVENYGVCAELGGFWRWCDVRS